MCSFRVCDRVAAFGWEVAATIYERAEKFLSPVEVRACATVSILHRRTRGQVLSRHRAPDPRQRCVEQGVPSTVPVGFYEPYGLNPCFRFVRYGPGGYFAPHHDGGFANGETDTSIKTFMLYLNDVVDGGRTNFFTEAQTHYKRPNPARLRHSFRPRAGSCLVFNHAITHDGSDVVSGEKWILRSEVMYQRLEPAEGSQEPALSASMP